MRMYTLLTIHVETVIGRPCGEQKLTKITLNIPKGKPPVKVIFNDPATIVFWHDGTKTVVKAIDEPFDPEKGLAMAFAKKYLGNEGNYYNTFKKWLPKEEEEMVFEIKIPDPAGLENLVDAMKKLTTRTRGMK